MRAARAIQARATEALDAADGAIAAKALHDAITQFVDAIRVPMSDGRLAWSAPMLEQVYDINYIDPTAVDLPDELAALSTAATMSAHEMAERPDVAMGLSILPLRTRARRGAPRAPVLEEAVLACREFWSAHGRGSWARSNISQRSSRMSNQHADLIGAAEKFLHDVVTAAGLPNDLSKLNSAWNSADRRLKRRQRAA
jgi:hypothetical protein